MCNGNKFIFTRTIQKVFHSTNRCHCLQKPIRYATRSARCQNSFSQKMYVNAK